MPDRLVACTRSGEPDVKGGEAVVEDDCRFIGNP